MTDNTDNQATDNFSIQDTMEMGVGNKQLLEDLMAPETSTADADDVTPIIKETEAPKAPPKGDPKGKEIVQKKEGEEPSGSDIIKNFLGDATDEEEEEEIPKEVVDDVEGEGEETDTTKFTALSKDLFDLGVFTKDEDEEDTVIGSPQELLERFQSEKKKGAIMMVNDFIGQFGDDYQKAFDAIYVKGVNPKEYFGVYDSTVNFAEIDLTDENNQVSVLRKALTEQGFESEDVDAQIEQLRNYGDLEVTAQRHHKVLVKKEAAKLQEMEAQSERLLQQKQIIKNQYISNVQGILQDKLKEKSFDGIPINPRLAHELQDFLLVDKYKTASGETLTDFDKAILEMKRPENHASKVKIALLLKIMEKDPNLTTIQRAGITKKSDALFVNTAKQVVKAKTPVKQKQTSWFQ